MQRVGYYYIFFIQRIVEFNSFLDEFLWKSFEIILNPNKFYDWIFPSKISFSGYVLMIVVIIFNNMIFYRAFQFTITPTQVQDFRR